MSITYLSNEYSSAMRLLALNPSCLSNEEIRQFKRQLYFKKLLQISIVLGLPSAYILLNKTKSNGVVPVIILSYLTSRFLTCLLTKKSSKYTDRLSLYGNDLKKSVSELNGFRTFKFEELGKTKFRTSYYEKFPQV